MCSVCKLAIGLALSVLTAVAAASPPTLRVCADPNNLPYSNDKREGFENRIAALIASDVHARLEYFWHPQRRGFVRSTIGSGHCDVVVGVPQGSELLETTRPYYRTSFAFVTRPMATPLRSFDDERLAGMRIGIQLTGEDYGNPPPAQALAARHLVDHIVGFTVYGDYSKAEPQRAIVDALSEGRIDAAVVWGPLAYFAAGRTPRLVVTPIERSIDRTGLPMSFAIAMGVKRGNHALRTQLDSVLTRRAAEITHILRTYRVPLQPIENARPARGAQS
jgi:mxaJ protein